MGAVGPSIQSLFIVLGCTCWGPAKAHPLSLECLLAPRKSWARQLLQPLAFQILQPLKRLFLKTEILNKSQNPIPFHLAC